MFYEIDDDHIQHMENALIYVHIDDHHGMIHEYKDSYNHYHLVNPAINYNESYIDMEICHINVKLVWIH